jgi:orotate phosphoribosyltransferase
VIDVASWALPATAPQGLDEGPRPLSELREQVKKIITANGLLELEAPVELASGDWSRWFIDGKRALASGENLRLACEAFIQLAEEMGVGHFDAVGGMTLGADQFSHGIALLKPCEWFVVRKAPKGRGTNRRVEGADIGAGSRVLLVDDVVTRGGSIREAYEVVRETGATIVGAVCLVDRGGHADAFFQELGVPYRALVTYKDLGIPAVGNE